MNESIFKLKPCPFCGGTAEMIEAPGNAYAGQKNIYRVECKKGIACPGMPGTRGYDTEREAAAAWNTRAPQAAAAEEDGDEH